MDPTESRVREFLSIELLAGATANFPLDASLLETGLIDSIGFFRLVSFLEMSFGIRVPDDDLLADNFQTLEKIIAYIDRREHSKA